MTDRPTKTSAGNYFEDFRLEQEIVHATPRTITTGDVALYTGLFGGRFAVTSADSFAESLGLPRSPIDDVLVFHIVFGKTVPDISLNAVANLGYAGGRFGAPVYPGDTVSATSRIVGLKENSNGKTGVVYVRTAGRNQDGAVVLDYVRWVMVDKRDARAPAPEAQVPLLPGAVAAGDLLIPDGLDVSGYDCTAAGSPHLWDDYAPGERIDHKDGVTVEESDHMTATRLYQNTARVHFNAHAAKDNRFGRRLIYGGHVISLARSISYNGLANGFRVAAINGGRHTAPLYAGDTVYAWSEVVEAMEIPGRSDVGALRLRTVATKDRPCADFPDKGTDGKDEVSVINDFDYTVLMPRR